MRRFLLGMGVLSLVTACSTGRSKSPGGGDGLDSAGPESVAPVDSGQDSGGASGGVELVGRVVWPEAAARDERLAVAATHVTWQSDTVQFGSTLSGVDVSADGVFSLELPARPPVGDHVHPAPSDHPELVGALYMLAAFVPTTTGSLYFSEGRPIRGMAFHRMLVWFDPETLGDSGWPGGWTLVDTGLAGSHNPPACLVGTTQPLMWRWADGYPQMHAIGAEDLLIELRGAPVPLTVAGAVEGDLGGMDRLAGVPQQVASGETTRLDPVVDVDLTSGTFSVTLDAAPPLGHNLGGEPGWDVTLAYLLQYADNGDGQWTLAGDSESTVTRSACHAGEPVYVRYTRDVETWRGARLLDCQGGQVGWRLLTLDDTRASYTALDDAASASLVVSAACRY